jgi:hypothetical protein
VRRDDVDGARMSPLSSHPLFNIPPTAYAHFKDDSRRNVVAFKGTEVSVAVGSTVRCAELRDDVVGEEAKDKKSAYQVCSNVLCVTNPVCKTFEFPAVTFPIKEILWNNSSTHLALVGTYELAVISFPRLGLTSHVKIENIPPKYVIHIPFL